MTRNDEVARAVAFAAKSTNDPNGSIPDQLADCRELAAREGLRIEAEFSDEAKSAYSGDRGPELARAIATAERLASQPGGCVLVVQHSDRLARGDGRRAKHLVEYALWAIKTSVTIRSVQDPQTFRDLLYAVVTGQRNHEDSARKSAATLRGLERRRERGQPRGAMPLGYKVDTDVVDGQVVTRRVVDPSTRTTVERIFDLIGAGHSPGAVARMLNREGRLTRRGNTWTARPVRLLVGNDVYTGRLSYPAIIDPERWQASNDNLARMDPAAVQRRKGAHRRATTTCSRASRSAHGAATRSTPAVTPAAGTTSAARCASVAGPATLARSPRSSRRPRCSTTCAPSRPTSRAGYGSKPTS